jgi:hypothetical protein
VIKHPAILDTAYGSAAWSPWARLTPIDPSGVIGEPLTPSSGRIIRSAEVWPRVKLTGMIPAGATPAQTRSPVSPYGGRIRYECGAMIPGEGLFTFVAATLDVTNTDIDRPSGLVTIEAASGEARVDEDRASLLATPAGTATAVITYLIRRTLGATWPVILEVPAGPAMAAGDFVVDGGVWEIVEAIATQNGWVVVFDANGAAVIKPSATVHSPPDLTISSETAGATMTGYRSRRRWGYNSALITYETDNGQTRTGTWQNTDPGSPINVTTAYGRHTLLDRVRVGGNLPTQAQCDAHAQTRGRRAGLFRSFELRAVPAPWLEPGDTVRSDLLGGTTRDMIVSIVEHPLDLLDVMIVTTVDTAETGDL